MRIVFLLLLLFATSASTAYSADSDLNYFNGVKWGSEIKADGDFKLKLTGSVDEKYYARKGGGSEYKGIPVKDITYKTKKGRFTDAHFVFAGRDGFSKIRAVLGKSFMKSGRTNANHITYEIQDGRRFVTATVHYNKGQGLVNFHFSGEKDSGKALKKIDKLK